MMFSEPLFSLSNKMYLMFSSNSWGQDQGFSARFTRLSSLCGGDTRFKDQSLSIQSPRLPLHGLYRRGYISCRWLYHQRGILKLYSPGGRWRHLMDTSLLSTFKTLSSWVRRAAVLEDTWSWVMVSTTLTTWEDTAHQWWGADTGSHHQTNCSWSILWTQRTPSQTLHWGWIKLKPVFCLSYLLELSNYLVDMKENWKLSANLNVSMKLKRRSSTVPCTMVCGLEILLVQTRMDMRSGENLSTNYWTAGTR